jgi:DNA-binding protein YbaB
MDEFKKFSDVLEGALKQKGTGTFTAKDETETVEVFINGDRCVTALHIEDGLLRLGAETVEERINEALMKANAEASASLDAMYGATFEALAKIVDSLQKTTSE